MTAKRHFVIDTLDEGYLVTVMDEKGAKDAAAEDRLAVIDRMFYWLGFNTAETTELLDAVRKAMAEKG